MPTEPLHAMDAWLKRYARLQAKQIPSTTDMPSAMRRVLLQEVRRLRDSREAARKPAVPSAWWSPIWPRVGVALGFLLFLGSLLIILLNVNRSTRLARVESADSTQLPMAENSEMEAGSNIRFMDDRQMLSPVLIGSDSPFAPAPSVRLTESEPNVTRSRSLAAPDTTEPTVALSVASRSADSSPAQAGLPPAKGDVGRAVQLGETAKLRPQESAVLSTQRPGRIWTFKRADNAFGINGLSAVLLGQFKVEFTDQGLSIREPNGSVYLGAWESRPGAQFTGEEWPEAFSFEVQGTNILLRQVLILRGSATQLPSALPDSRWTIEGTAVWGKTNQVRIRAESMGAP